jgi:ABC-type branched-subunit amino acid transport system substrate-binding protein
MNLLKKIKYILVLIILVFSGIDGMAESFIVLGNTPPGGLVTEQRQQDYRVALALCGKAELQKKAIDFSFNFVPGLSKSSADIVREAAVSQNMGAIGFSYSKEAIAAASVADELNFPVISPSASHDSLWGRRAFLSLGMNSQMQASLLVQWMLENRKNEHNVHVVVSADEVTSTGMWKNLERLLKGAGFRVTKSIFVQTDSSSPARVANETLKSKASTVIFTSFWKASVPIIQKLDSFRGQIVGQHEWAYNLESMNSAVGELREFIVISDHLPKGSSLGKNKEVNALKSDFESKYQKAFGSEPTALAYSICDTARFISLISSENAPKSRSEFINAMRLSRTWAGVRGANRMEKGQLTTPS